MKRLDCIGPVVLVVLWHGALLAAYVHHGGDVGVLTCVGPDFAGRFPYEEFRQGIGGGYDGQFYYAIARAPWHKQVVGVDMPAARHVRVLYPALAWAVTGGDKHLLLWALPAINLAAIGVLAWMGALAARSSGLSGWWGLLLPQAVNAGLISYRNLSDVVSVCAVCGLLLAHQRRWPTAVVAAWAAAAVFCREQNTAVAALVLLVAAVRGRWREAAALGGVLLAWGGWFVWLRFQYGVWPLLPAEGNLGRPLSGLWFAWTHPPATTSGAAVNGFCVLVLAVQVALAPALLFTRPDPALFLTAVAGAALAVIGGEFIYCDYWSFMRVYAWLPLALWLGFAREGVRWPLAVLAAPGVLPPLLILRQCV